MIVDDEVCEKLERVNGMGERNLIFYLWSKLLLDHKFAAMVSTSCIEYRKDVLAVENAEKPGFYESGGLDAIGARDLHRLILLLILLIALSIVLNQVKSAAFPTTQLRLQNKGKAVHTKRISA